MKEVTNRAFLCATVLLLTGIFAGQTANAQLRRPAYITIKHEDRNKSNLLPERGAVYLDGLVAEEVNVRITKAGPAYANLTARTWLGNVLANQNGVLLAVSDKAYRVRAKAQQGQIAGWVSKSIVEGIPEGFEEKLVKFHERYEMVKQLIDDKQVALGMTTDEVVQSIGPPDAKSSQLDATGRKDVFEFISYKRTPQEYVTYGPFGIPTIATRYVEVEDGRVTIEFTDNLVTAINETAGLNFNRGLPFNNVPPYFPLF